MTSIMIISILMFFLKQSTLSLFCVYYTLMLYRNAFVVSNNVASDERDVLDKAVLGIQQKCDESVLCVQ